MKRFLNFTKPTAFLFILFASFFSFKAGAQPGYDDEVSMQTFYDELEPYGQWVDDPEYGYVWVPEVDDPDFRPYATNGHWAMTEYGNMWVSDYEWGWAPFHYGRWAYTDYYGWIWIPDTEWAPAWVSWRSNDDYYGWAPMGPKVSIDVAIGPTYSCPDFWWSFVPRTYIYQPRWYDYYIPYYRNRTIISATIILGNTYHRDRYRYVCGPDIYDLRRGGINVNIYNITNINRPGRTIIRNNYVNVYRPSINSRGSYRPSRMMTRNEYRSDRGRNANRNFNYNGNRPNNNSRFSRPNGYNNNRSQVGNRPNRSFDRTRTPANGERRNVERGAGQSRSFGNRNTERSRNIDRPQQPQNNPGARTQRPSDGREIRTPGSGNERRMNTPGNNRPPQREVRERTNTNERRYNGNTPGRNPSSANRGGGAESRSRTIDRPRQEPRSNPGMNRPSNPQRSETRGGGNGNRGNNNQGRSNGRNGRNG